MDPNDPNSHTANMDMTVAAEKLIRSISRAFYTDDCICVIDVLIRDKYLRDDDMEKRLKISTKTLRKVMGFLQKEQIVFCENVDDLASGGSRFTTFWYIDYFHAVKVITYRIHLLLTKIENDEKTARTSGMYVCPNYTSGGCNGRYTEIEAQHCIDYNTGSFVCVECRTNDPDSDQAAHTLTVIDNTEQIQQAMRNMKKVKTQLSEKLYPGTSKVIRTGVLELLKLVRSSKIPLSNNMPSENYSYGIGSTRLSGTGRTATFKAKKARMEGKVVDVGQTSGAGVDLLYLKNSRGEEFAFEVEEGGSEIAKMLSRGSGESNEEDYLAAAKRIREREVQSSKRGRTVEKEAATKRKKAKNSDIEFLHDVTIRKTGGGVDRLNKDLLKQGGDDDDDDDDEDDDDEEDEEDDEEDEGKRVIDEEERARLFQEQYMAELAKQKALLLKEMEDDKEEIEDTIDRHTSDKFMTKIDIASLADDSMGEEDVEWE